MTRATYAAVGTLGLLILSKLGLAQSPIPRDTLAARQLDSLSRELRKPVAVKPDTVPVIVIDSAAIRVLIAQNGALRTTIAQLTAVIDSLTAPVPPPVPVPVPVPLPTPTPNPSPGVAELPRAVPAHRDPYPGRACTVTLSPGASIQPALTSARGGEVICLLSGIYPLVTLPARVAGDTGWVVIRAASLTVAEGTRMTPGLAIGLPKIVLTANSQIGIRTTAATHSWYIAGIEVALGAATSVSYGLVQLGDGSQSTLAAVPSRIVLSRMWIHGTATATVRRCVELQSASTAVVDSWLDECHEKGADSQAIWGHNGPGPYLIQNNYLAGCGQNIMFGGADPRIAGLVPSDITIRRNHLNTPTTWKGALNCTKKTIYESKNSARTLMEGNILEGSWQDAWGGEAVALKSVSQSGGCRWCRTTDFTFRLNLIQNVGAGFNISGAPEAQPVDSALRRVSIVDNVLVMGQQSGYGRAFAFSGGTGKAIRDLEVSKLVIAGTISQSFMLIGANAAINVTVDSLVAVRGASGMTGTNGLHGLAAWTGNTSGTRTWNAVTVIGVSNGVYPPGTTFASSEPPWAAAIRARVAAATAGVR